MEILAIIDKITISDIQTGLFALVSIITSIITLYKLFQNSLKKMVVDPFNQRIDEMKENNNSRFKDLQLQTDKNYLVRFLADVEEGEKVDETELEHFYYTYDSYHKNGGNSYIDHKVEKLKKEGKL